MPAGTSGTLNNLDGGVEMQYPVTVSLEVPYAILFANDPELEDIEIPEFDPEAPCAATTTCISIATRAYVDGEVMVMLRHPDENRDPHLKRVFDGALETTSGRVGIFTAEDELLLSMGGLGMQTRIAVWLDEEENASVVLVEASRLEGSKSATGKSRD